MGEHLLGEHLGGVLDELHVVALHGDGGEGDAALLDDLDEGDEVAVVEDTFVVLHESLSEFAHGGGGADVEVSEGKVRLEDTVGVQPVGDARQRAVRDAVGSSHGGTRASHFLGEVHRRAEHTLLEEEVVDAHAGVRTLEALAEEVLQHTVVVHQVCHLGPSAHLSFASGVVHAGGNGTGIGVAVLRVVAHVAHATRVQGNSHILLFDVLFHGF